MFKHRSSLIDGYCVYIFTFFSPPLILIYCFRLTERQQTFGEKVIASLQISNIQTDDGGSYVCQASNLYGRDQQLVQLYVQEPPNRPNDLRVISVTSTTVNVQWDHNGDQTSKYIIQHKKSDGTHIPVHNSGETIKMFHDAIDLDTTAHNVKRTRERRHN